MCVWSELDEWKNSCVLFGLADFLIFLSGTQAAMLLVEKNCHTQGAHTDTTIRNCNQRKADGKICMFTKFWLFVSHFEVAYVWACARANLRSHFFFDDGWRFVDAEWTIFLHFNGISQRLHLWLSYFLLHLLCCAAVLQNHCIHTSYTHTHTHVCVVRATQKLVHWENV